MSTRATYEFISEFCTNTIYIHHDGYLQGAAYYFWNMHHNHSKGNAASRFLRANEQAELTGDHNSHGDTEYRYTLDKKGKLTAMNCGLETGNKWKVVFRGHYAEFLNKYGPKSFMENFEELRELKTREYMEPEWVTRSELVERIALARAEAARFKPDNPNHTSYLKQAERLEILLEEWDGPAPESIPAGLLESPQKEEPQGWADLFPVLA